MDLYDILNRVTLRYTGELDEVSLIYCVRDSAGRRISDWFSGKEMAESTKSAKSGKYNIIDSIYFDSRVIKPIQFPHPVVFKSGKDGRLFAKLNLHPEINGNRARLKIYFPDKSFIEARPGPALITSVKEYDRYGFLFGEMEKYCMPENLENFLDWAWDNMLPEAPIAFVKHPILGKFLFMWPNYYVKPVIYGYECEIIPMDIEQQYIQREVTLVELYIESAFGRSMDSFLSDFENSRFYEQKFEFEGTRWVPDTAFYSDLVDEVIEEGFLRQRRLDGTKIRVFTYDSAHLHKMARFSEDEIAELVNVFSRVNREADEAITAKLRKGALRAVHS